MGSTASANKAHGDRCNAFNSESYAYNPTSATGGYGATAHHSSSKDAGRCILPSLVFGIFRQCWRALRKCWQMMRRHK